jgi:glycosyltransferase involved in cell wall biosynthesis
VRKKDSKICLLVAGDFVRTGGMDVANYALASFLAEQGWEVHLVAHRVEDTLAQHSNVFVHATPKVADSYALSSPLLNAVGRYWAKRVSARGGRVIVNGGNCRWNDINWVHYVHAAYQPQVNHGQMRQLKTALMHRKYLTDERRNLRASQVVIANSNLTKDHLITLLGISAERIHTIYYGIDDELFRLATFAERDFYRQQLLGGGEQPMVAFVGGLGDRRKGFDALFAAWRALCEDGKWDADLVVIGGGGELSWWKTEAAGCGLAQRVRFLGFRHDVPKILAACDALVAPTRYEAYGLGVQEALCCGLPALVSRRAGVAERYPPELRSLLLDDPNDVSELIARLRAWRAQANELRASAVRFSSVLRAHTWKQMGAQILALMTNTG